MLVLVVFIAAELLRMADMLGMIDFQVDASKF
jgi:hypothetical protein